MEWFETKDCTKKRAFGKESAAYSNLIKGSCPVKAGVVYIKDFTYPKWNQKIIYLATFMGLYAREIVGWNLSTRHTKEFVIDTLLGTVVIYGKPLIVYTDQTAQYRGKEHQQLMTSLGFKISTSWMLMTRKWRHID